MTKTETDQAADRLLELLDIGLKQLKSGDGDSALLALQEALKTANRLPKKAEREPQ
jgi:hypothetical protein